MKILKSTHRNNSGLLFTITIYDREAVTSPEIVFLCGPDFVKIKTHGDRSDTFKRIIPASAEFTIMTGCEVYTTEQEDAIAEFYFNLTNSFEGRFYVTIIAGTDMLFQGKILPDVGDYLISQYGDFAVTAIDGITDLQDIEYRPTDYTDLTPESAIQTYTFNEHFIDILQRIDSVLFFKEVYNSFSTSLSLLSTAANWTESQSITGDIFEQVKVRNYWFEKVGTGSYRKYRSCWEVLTDLLTGFNARMYYARGRYNVEQISYADNNPLYIDIYHYNVFEDTVGVGATLTRVQHDYDTDDDLWAGAGATKGRLPAFKAVELEQGKQFTNYINGMAMSVPGNSGPFDFGYVIGTGNKLVLQWNVELLLGTAWSVAPYSSTILVEWILTFKMKIGDYWMVADDPKYAGTVGVQPTGSYHVGNGGVVPVINWALTDSTVTVKWERTFISSSLNDFQTQVSTYTSFVRNSALVIESSEILGNGNLIIELVDFVTKRNGTIIGGSPKGTFQLVKTSRVIIASGYKDLYDQPKGIKRYEIGDTRNSLVYKTKLGYYDSDKATTNQLFMKASGTPNQVPTVEWTDPDPGLTLPIEELMMKSILAMRKIPAQIYNMALFYKTTSQIHFGDQVVIGGAVTIPLDMEMIASGPGGFTTYRVVMWELYKDYIGINVVDTGDEDDPIDPTPYPLPDGGLDLVKVAGPVSGVEYWEEWTAVSTAYVAPANGDDYTLINIDSEYTTTIKKKWHFYINGVKQLYTPTGTLALRQWRFDLDNNRIVFFKGSGPVAHIEVYKYY